MADSPPRRWSCRCYGGTYDKHSAVIYCRHKTSTTRRGIKVCIGCEFERGGELENEMGTKLGQELFQISSPYLYIFTNIQQIGHRCGQSVVIECDQMFNIVQSSLRAL